MCPLALQSRRNRPAFRAISGVTGRYFRLSRNALVTCSSVSRRPAYTSVMITEQQTRRCPWSMSWARYSERPFRPLSGRRQRKNRGEALSSEASIPEDSVLETLIGLAADLIDVWCAAPGKFGMVSVSPTPGGKLQCQALFVALHIAPENIEGTQCAAYIRLPPGDQVRSRGPGVS